MCAIESVEASDLLWHAALISVSNNGREMSRL